MSSVLWCVMKGRALAPPAMVESIGVSTSSVPVAVEDAAEGLDYLRALAEDVAHLGVRDEVGVALAVADLHVLEAVVLLGHRAQRLREKREAAHRERQLAALRAEGNADEADEVARVDPFFEEGVVLLAEHVELEAELQAVEAVSKVAKAVFPWRRRTIMRPAVCISSSAHSSGLRQSYFSFT